MKHFTIMSAASLFASDGKANISRVIEEFPGDRTVIVAQRINHHTNRSTPIFICGAPGDYGVQAGDTVTFTIDTGSGYRESSDCIKIEKLLHYKGLMVDGTLEEPRKTGRRRVWVFK